MDTKDVIAKGEGHLETVTGSEIVLMQIDDGRFFTLSGTARRVWELIDEPTSIDALAERLTEEFEVERQACVRDLLHLFGELGTRNLIDVTPAAGA